MQQLARSSQANAGPSWICPRSRVKLQAKLLSAIVNGGKDGQPYCGAPRCNSVWYRYTRSTSQPFQNLRPLFRAAGILIAILAVGSTSYVYVPNGFSAHLFRIYGGGPLPEGRIVAADEENGPQARILPPGFHLAPLINVLYSVDTQRPEVEFRRAKSDCSPRKTGRFCAPGRLMPIHSRKNGPAQ